MTFSKIGNVSISPATKVPIRIPSAVCFATARCTAWQISAAAAFAIWKTELKTVPSACIPIAGKIMRQFAEK